MDAVFNRYKELFQKRYELVSSIDMGEDSVRYDFFVALMEAMNLKPWDIQVEVPMGPNSFIPNPERSPNQTRNEKPVMDLSVNTPNIKLCVEFGLFRTDSNKAGNIDTTARFFKMKNDFLRLGIYSHLHHCKAYFVCVADKKMLNKRVGNPDLEPFPAQNYEFHYSRLIEIMGTSSVAKKKVEKKFLHRFRDLNLTLIATKIMDEEITSVKNPFETRILIWEINTSEYKN